MLAAEKGRLESFIDQLSIMEQKDPERLKN
jgi:hypothetical protein